MGWKGGCYKLDFTNPAQEREQAREVMMQAAIPFPNISPEIFTLPLFGMELSLRWYALAYIVGILIGWRLVIGVMKSPRLWPGDTAPMTVKQVEDLLTWIVLGVILGGRLGFVLFYQPVYYFSHPAEILQVWQGGMSFHGGFLGVIIAAYAFCHRHGISKQSTTDALAIGTPAGLLLGRIANFINAELWGRPTDLPWGVTFPGRFAQDCPDIIGLCARHPSQLYEAALEGLLLGAVLLYLAWRRGVLKYPGMLSGVFLIGYGASRFIVEFARQADAQFITLENPTGYAIQFYDLGLTMGQLLSLPMIFVGVISILIARRRNRGA